MSINNTITSLRQIGIKLHRGGARHRQERIARFIHLERNQQQYKLFENLALQSVTFLFPNASSTLHQRMATSIAMRRARFLYLEQHQFKLRALEVTEEPQNTSQSVEVAIPISQDETEIPKVLPAPPSLRSRAMPSLYQRTELSRTIATKIDVPKKAESVASVQMTVQSLPPMPSINKVTGSFSCPYCFLICPSSEANSEEAWHRHLISDFEPFFCTVDECSEPFHCSTSYAAWRSHVQRIHAQPEWHCWYCQSPSASSPKEFLSEQAFKDHLEVFHSDRLGEAVLSTVIKHSEVRSKVTSQTCGFCGGYPEEIEVLHPIRESPEAMLLLENHIKEHFMSLSLILLPVVVNEDAQHDHGMESDADRGNESHQDLENLPEATDFPGETGNRRMMFIAEEGLYCGNDQCDCRLKSSIPSGVFSSFAATFALDAETEDLPNIYDPLYNAYNLSNQAEEWEFWYPRPLPPGSDPTVPEYPSIEDDEKLQQYFQLPALQSNNQENERRGFDKEIQQIIRSLGQNLSPDQAPFQWFKNRIPIAAPDTCDWIYSSKPVQNWRADITNLIVVTGAVGTGKSVIVKYMLEASFEKGCYFFFSDGAIWSNHALAAILIQIAENWPDILGELIEESGGTSHYGYRSSEYLCELFERIAAMELLTPIFVYLDGIERCLNLPDMQRYIQRILAVDDSSFRFFITARSKERLAYLFKDSRYRSEIIDLDNSVIAQKGAQMLLQHRLRQLALKGYWSSDIDDAVTRRILRRPRNFLTDDMIIQYLKWKRPFPTAIEDIPVTYEDVMNRFLHERWFLDSDRQLICMAAMSEWPLTLMEVANIMALGNITKRSTSTEMCSSFDEYTSIKIKSVLEQDYYPLISVCEGRISFDQLRFLDTVTTLSKPPPGFAADAKLLNMVEIDRVVADACSLYLDLFNRLPISDLSDLEDADALYLLPYAARNWPSCLMHSASPNTNEIPEHLRQAAIRLFDPSCPSFKIWYPVYRSAYFNTASAPSLPCSSAIIAAFFGMEWLTMVYLNNGVDINAQDAGGCTALFWAVSRGHTEIISNLLQLGADVAIKNEQERTALTQAVSNSRLDTVKLLLEFGAIKEVKADPNHTIISTVVTEGPASMIEYFIAEGVDLASRNDLLQLSLLHQQDDITKLLLERGAALDFSDADNRPYFKLHLSVIRGPIVTGLVVNYTRQFAKSRTLFPHNSRIRIHPQTRQEATFDLYDRATDLHNKFAPVVQALKDMELGRDRKAELRTRTREFWNDMGIMQDESALHAMAFLTAKTMCLDKSFTTSHTIDSLETTISFKDVVTQLQFDFLLSTEYLLVEQYEASGMRTRAIALLREMLNRQHAWEPTPGIERLDLLQKLARLYHDEGNFGKSTDVLWQILSIVPPDSQDREKMAYLRRKHDALTRSSIAAIASARIPMSIEETAEALASHPSPPSHGEFVEPELDSDRFAILHMLLINYCEDKNVSNTWRILTEIEAILVDRARDFSLWGIDGRYVV